MRQPPLKTHPMRTRLFDVNEAAEVLSVSVPWIYKAVRERRIPVTRIGRALRFDPATLERFIARSTIEAREQRPA
jgi:excisionase family DNA binding protein